MPSGDFFRRIEDRLRRLAEAPLDDASAPLALRDRVVDAVEDRLAPTVGANGPCGRLEVRLFAASEARRAMLDEALAVSGALEGAVRRRLAEIGVPADDRLEMDVAVVEEEDAETPFAVRWTPDATPAEATAPRGRGRYRLTVLEGDAGAPHQDFDAAATVFVGRLPEVHDAEGRLVRRNDVAFSDAADGPDATVSRAHARLGVDAETGALRLYDEDSTRGTSIFRAGGAGLIPVRRRGLALSDGDLIYFGDARVRFEWLDDT